MFGTINTHPGVGAPFEFDTCVKRARRVACNAGSTAVGAVEAWTGAGIGGVVAGASDSGRIAAGGVADEVLPEAERGSRNRPEFISVICLTFSSKRHRVKQVHG